MPGTFPPGCTRFYAARQKGEDVTEADFTTEEEIHLAPLPFMKHLGAEQRPAKVQEILAEIEEETIDMHRRDGTAPLGAEAVCRVDPQHRPNRLARSPQPCFHATKQVLRTMMGGFREFMIAYRAAVDKLAFGDRSARFPENCYPPGLLFVQPA